MQIEALNDVYKVVQPSLGDFYLGSEVVEYLKRVGRFESLEDLEFYAIVKTGDWEITDSPPPSSNIRTVASLIWNVGGKFHPLQDGKMVCGLSDRYL